MLARKAYTKASLVLMIVCTLAACKPAAEAPEAVTAPVAKGQVLAKWADRIEIHEQDYQAWLQWRGLPDQQSNLVEFATGIGLSQSARERDDESVEPSATEVERQVHQQILGDALDAHMAADIQIAESEIDAILTANPDAYARPRRYLLSNIYLPLPESAQAQADVRARIKALRDRAEAGEDFAALAREASQSQTRFRDGRVGLMALNQLPPRIAAEIEPLQAGQLSPVIEAAGGLSIYLCERVDEGIDVPLAKVREQIGETLKQRKAEIARRAFNKDLLSGAGLTGDTPGALLSLRQLRADKARSLGLDQLPEIQADMRWRTMQQLARREMDRRVEALRKEPDMQAMREQFAALQSRGEGMVRYHVAGIAFGPAKSTTVQAARRVLLQIENGELSFADAARTHSVDASASQDGDLGWFNVRTLAARDWIMMRAMRQIGVGELSGVLNSDKGIWIYRLLGKQAGKEVSFEDVRPELEERALHAQTRVLEKAVRMEIVRELVLQPSQAETAPDSDGN